MAGGISHIKGRLSMNTIKTVIAILTILNIAALISADQSEIPEIIDFTGRTNTKAALVDYPTRFEGPVRFSHKKHVESYGAGCGDCHHDSELYPIEVYDPSETYSCEECHYDRGLVRGPKIENNMSEADQLMHRPNAIHAQCLGCHKKFNKEKHLVVAPEACISCHKKQY
jgi:hypothetical protein